MKLICLVIVCILHLCSGYDNGSSCKELTDFSGRVSDSVKRKPYLTYQYHQNCWIIRVPETSYISLQLENTHFQESCQNEYVLVKVPRAKIEYVYCDGQRTKTPIMAESNVKIEYHVQTDTDVSFEMSYKIEDQYCKKRGKFRCSDYSCIPRHKRCDGVSDCENGKDEIMCEKGICNSTTYFPCSDDYCIREDQVCDGWQDCENGADELCDISRRNGISISSVNAVDISGIKGITLSRTRVIASLKKERSTSFGWGVNTHRAITALYLSGGAKFDDGSLEEELMVKQLELQTALALLRNSSNPLSVNELSMFVNALKVTCHNPRRFYGHDLVKILEERLHTSKSSKAGVYLTLCNADWTFSESDMTSVLESLNTHSGYPFQRDIQAMTVMAVTCIKNKTKDFYKISNATEIYEDTIKNFIASQQTNGSFGNVHTTALVSQALLSCGQENTQTWNITATLNYLMEKLNSPSYDFLTTILTIPVLNGKSLVDVGHVKCNKPRIREATLDDVINELDGKMQLKYSLFIGDDKDIIHRIFLRMPENCSAFDLMEVAKIADPKYKFLFTGTSGNIYVHEIAGISNDPEAGKFWLLYVGHVNGNGTITHRNISPDKLILHDNEHFIMWYKTVHTEE